MYIYTYIWFSFEEANIVIPMLQIRKLKMDNVKFILLELEFQPRESGYEAYISNSIMPPLDGFKHRIRH